MHSMLKRVEILKLAEIWIAAWNRHDLSGVLEPMADQVLFKHWNGSVINGREQLRRVWWPWFAASGDFHFAVEDMQVDEVGQAFVFQWRLEWPSPELAFAGQRELREGVDVVRLCDGKISSKQSYIMTHLKIGNRSIQLEARL